MIQFDEHIFQMGWNHQLGMIIFWFPLPRFRWNTFKKMMAFLGWWPFGDAFGNWFGTSTWKVKKATFSDGREGVVYQDTAPEVNVTWLSVYVYFIS